MGYDFAFDASLKSRDLYGLGDSLTALGSSDWYSYLQKTSFPRSAAQNSGVGGIDSAAVLAKQITDLAISGKPYAKRMTLIWTGVHDIKETGFPGTCVANVASIVANCLPGWFRILECLPVSETDMYTGTTYRNLLNTFNSTMSSTYGSRFVPLIAPLQAGGNGSTQDNLDITNGVIPTSLRDVSDTIHMTLISSAGLTGGNGIVYQQVLASLASGW